ncbi:MAG TPA: SHOCT domain-containing protein [Solirubrobacteraceae bacterium]|nr:SHOCT domain-containing protein [Solirubrobacteraceae bacterium]
MRRRRPLLRGAMVGGVGYMAGKAGANRAAQEASQEQRIESLEGPPAATAPPAAAAPAAAPPAAAAAPSTIEQLKQLGELRDGGVLTPAEFEREKQKLLGGGA